MTQKVKPCVLKGNGKQRLGQGFSLLELKKAGISLQQAARLEIPADRNRKTAHDNNVEIVKAYFAKATEAKPKLEPKTAPPKEARKKAKT